jgi:hypothetical protein
MLTKPASFDHLHQAGSRIFAEHWHHHDNAPCPDPYGHFEILPRPSALREEGIQFTIVSQTPGEILVITPRCLHCGLNEGPKFSEALALSQGQIGPHFTNKGACPKQPWRVTDPQVQRFQDVNKYKTYFVKL